MASETSKPSNALMREYSAVLRKYTKQMNKDLQQLLKHNLSESNNGEIEVISTTLPTMEHELPIMAQDSFFSIEKLLASFFGFWERRLDTIAKKTSEEFVEKTKRLSTRQMRRMLKKNGFTVNFSNSAQINNLAGSIYAENVSLIKTIPKKMHEKVTSIVKKHVENGEGLYNLSLEIEKLGYSSEKWARFIAKDQTRKAHINMSIVRSKEAGIEYGIWMQSLGGKASRKTHHTPPPNGIKGIRFKLSEGAYDPAVKQYIMPGQLPGCGCDYKPDLSSFNPSLASDSVTVKYTNNKHY